MSAPPIRQHNFSPFGRGDERGTPVYPRGTPLLGEPLSHEINCYWTSYPSAPSHTHQRQITRECTISHRYYTHTHPMPAHAQANSDQPQQANTTTHTQCGTADHLWKESSRKGDTTVGLGAKRASSRSHPRRVRRAKACCLRRERTGGQRRRHRCLLGAFLVLVVSDESVALAAVCLIVQHEDCSRDRHLALHARQAGGGHRWRVPSKYRREARLGRGASAHG